MAKTNTTDALQPGQYAQIGMTGLRRSGGYVQEEWLKDLRSRPAKIYREMSENDAVIGGVLYAVTTLMRRTERRVEPADAESMDDAEAADFIEGVLDGMEEPWSVVLEEIFSYLTYGWSVHEEVYKIREDGKIVWAELPIRGQDTLTRWEFDDHGKLLGMWQSAAPTYRETFIPASKFLHFRGGAYKGNPEGRSLLRRAYRAYYFATRIEEREAIGIERELCGLPVVSVPGEWMAEGATDAQKAAVEVYKKLATDIRLNNEGGVVIPAIFDNGTKDVPGSKLPKVKIELLSTQGRRAIDTDKVIARYDQRKAMVVLADFILLGHEGVGSYSLGVSKAELFATAIEAHLGDVADVFNRVGIPRLLALNGMKGKCNLAFGQADRADLAQLGSFIHDVGGIDVLLDDNEISAVLRAAAQLPEEVTPRDPSMQRGAAGGDAAGEDSQPKLPPGKQPAKKRRSFPLAARGETRGRVAKDLGAAGADEDPVDEIARRLEPTLRRRFLQAVESMRGRVDLPALDAALEAADAEAAEAALGLELAGAEFAELRAAIRDAFEEAGEAVTERTAERLAVELVFEVANPRVTAWLEAHGAELVRSITTQQRTALRQVLVDAAAAGVRPKRAAILEHIGQSERDSRAIASFEQQLRAAGETEEKIARKVRRYARRKLEDRADVIAENETLEAAGQARHESWTQAIEAGYLPDDVRRAILVGDDERVCPVCDGLRGETRGMDEDWIPGKRHTPLHILCRCPERLVFGAVAATENGAEAPATA
jgi:SPP1 gp7 family putative phage head morphogenesis protein